MPTEAKKKPELVLSIDWEDFGQLFCKYLLGQVRPPKEADIDRQTDIILELFDGAGAKGTFFVLGILAKYRPDLVRKIQAEGHEIALHGMWHEAMFEKNRAEAFSDLSDSQKLVSDIVGQPVVGYRAPFFSIIKENLWALEILAELGFVYDSSIFPKKMPRYGIEGFSNQNTLYELPNGSKIVELPLMTVQKFGKEWPISGGGYLRAMPKFLVRSIFNDLDAASANGMIYMHPYEFDTKFIDITSSFEEGEQISPLKKQLLNLKWNLFRQSIRGKIYFLLHHFHFTTCIKKAEDVQRNSHRPTILG